MKQTWQKYRGIIGTLGLLAVILWCGVQIGEYNARQTWEVDAAEYQRKIDKLDDKLGNKDSDRDAALKEQRAALLQEKADEITRMTNVCGMAAAEAFRASQSAAAQAEASERATKQQVEAIKKARGRK